MQLSVLYEGQVGRPYPSEGAGTGKRGGMVEPDAKSEGGKADCDQQLLPKMISRTHFQTKRGQRRMIIRVDQGTRLTLSYVPSTNPS